MFNTVKKTVPDTVNLAVHSAFSLSPEIELYFAVASTFLKDTYYESSDNRVSRIIELVKKCDDKFVAQLAIYNRTKNNMRSATTLLLGELFKNKSEYARIATIAAVRRPDDLTELFAYIGRMTKQLKRAIRRSLYKFDRYQLGKYQSKNKNVSLVDLFNLTHPKPEFATEEQKVAWKDLIDGNLKSDSMQSILAGTKSGSAERLEILSKEILENKMGIFALLKNLNKLDGASKEVKDAVVSKLTSEVVIEKSKLLPFRFIDAMDNVTDRDYLAALEKAVQLSCKNIPKFDGKTLVALDVSGSMSGEPIKIASLIAGALSYVNNCDVVCFDYTVKEHKIIPGTPMLAVVNQIRAVGGGTDTGAVFRYAQKNYDQIVIVSDNESWSGSAQQEYKNHSNGVKLYSIDVQGYGTVDVKGHNVFHISGWSASMFDFITTGVDNLLTEIKSIEIPS